MHHRCPRRVISGSPGKHPVYDRLRERDFERVDGYRAGGALYVSRKLFEALKEQYGKPAPPPRLDRDDGLKSPLENLASLFAGMVLHVDETLPYYRRRKQRSFKHPQTLTLSKEMLATIEAMNVREISFRRMQFAQPCLRPSGGFAMMSVT